MADKGGIGGSGVGWGGSGAQSRSDAAHAGADFGGQRGTVGGGGRSPGRGSGGSGAVDTGRSPSEKSKGRRASALATFGLQTPSMTELGEFGWSESGHRSREKAANIGLERGAQKALDVAGMRTAGSVVGAEGVVDAYGKLSSLGMTPNEERGFNEVQSQRTGLAPLGTAAKQIGPAGLLVNTALNVVDYSKQADYAKNRFNITPAQSRRRSRALAAFDSNNSNSGSRVTPASNPHTGNNWTWEPASYGVGEYGNHVKGLLS